MGRAAPCGAPLQRGCRSVRGRRKRRGRVPKGAQEAATDEERWGDALLGGWRQKGFCFS
jgi:hypothetical protein